MKKKLYKATTQFTLLVFVTASYFVAAAQPNTWTRKADFGGGIRYAGVGFSIGHKGYLGTGWGLRDNNPERKDDFWEFDPKTNSWTQKANFPGGPRIYAIGMAIGNKGYVGMGYAGEYTDKKNDFWQYDPVKNTWSKKADYVGTLRVYSVSFSVRKKGYVGTGRPNDGTLATNDFWEYDPKSDKWTRKADFAGSLRYWAAAFSIGKKGYIGGGVLDTPGLIFANDLWEYDPAKDKWSQKADFGGEGRSLLTGFSVNKKGYMGLGSTEGRNGGTKKEDFWEYDPRSDSWTQISDYGPGATSEAIGFGIDGKGYVGLGAGNTPINPIVSRFWEYTPNAHKKRATNITNTGTAKARLSGMPAVETLQSFVVKIAPNPFHSSTRIQYEIPDEGYVTVKLFDLYGRKINTLVNAKQSRGVYSTSLNCAELVEGLYIYQVEYWNKNAAYVKTGKIVLIK